MSGGATPGFNALINNRTLKYIKVTFFKVIISNKLYIVEHINITITKNKMEVMTVLFKQKTKLSKGSVTNNSVRTTLPSTIARMMNVKIGDKIEWTVESVNDELKITVSKVDE